LRLTVSANQLQCQFLGVDLGTKATSLVDHFALDLTEHVVS